MWINIQQTMLDGMLLLAVDPQTSMSPPPARPSRTLKQLEDQSICALTSMAVIEPMVHLMEASRLCMKESPACERATGSNHRGRYGKQRQGGHIHREYTSHAMAPEDLNIRRIAASGGT